jgi:Alg9-like mannosyltransferase family
MLVIHKEARFMLPIAPILIVLAAVGFSELCRRFCGWQRSASLILAFAVLMAVAVMRVPEINWNSEPFRCTAYLLHEAGRRDDLTGVVIIGFVNPECANYFYLRQNVPLTATISPKLEKMQRPSSDAEARFNYMICRTDEADAFATFRPVAIALSGELTLCRMGVPGRAPSP